MRSKTLLACLAGLVVAVAPAAAGDCDGLRAESPGSRELFRIRDGEVASASSSRGAAETRRLALDTSALADAAPSLVFPLAAGGCLRAQLTELEDRGPGDVAWRGRLDEGGGQVILTLKEGFVAGLIYAPGAVYEVGTLADGTQALSRLDYDLYPPCGGALDPPRELVPGTAAAGDRSGSDLAVEELAAPTVRDSANRIDLLGLYSPQARLAAGGHAAVRATIQAAVDATNTAFANSDVTTRFRLVHTAETTRNEAGGDLSADLQWLRSDPGVAALRNQVRADMVGLTVFASTICGRGYAMRTPGPGFAPFAFQVTVLGCAVGNLTYAHEHGHNMGMEHDPANGGPPNAVSYPFSFGHFVDGSYRTIMSYQTECFQGCPKAPNFSNPAVSVQGAPTGIANQRDNHRTANLTAGIVANFRQSVTVPAAPTDLDATALSGTEVELSWRDRSNNETGFVIEAGEAGGEIVEAGTVEANTTSTTVSDLAPATEYAFRVKARNAQGDSGYSNTALATTEEVPPAAPVELEAVTRSATEILLLWEDASDNEEAFVVEARTVAARGGAAAGPAEGFTYVGSGFEVVATVSSDVTSLMVGGLDAATTYNFRVRADNVAGSSPSSAEAAATTAAAGPPEPCVAGPEALCLLDGRFRVEAFWRNQHAGGTAGQGTAVADSGKSGFFWFFNSTNLELVVKMLDGRSINNAFWLFFGALSDVEYWIVATDTTDGGVSTYYNDPGNICGQADLGAFIAAGGGPMPQTAPAATGLPAAVGLPGPTAVGALPPAAPRDASGTCAPGPTTLCLLEGRFQVEVTWHNHRNGETGTGGAVPSPASDRTGFFWFFNPANLELLVKVLDGTAINGKYWVFYGALSDVEYWITVADTVTGEDVTYHNEPGNICGRGDLGALDG